MTWYACVSDSAGSNQLNEIPFSLSDKWVDDAVNERDEVADMSNKGRTALELFQFSQIV